jgi:hypothetical protein
MQWPAIDNPRHIRWLFPNALGPANIP